ncbi:peptidase C12 ubiquitin carboxyl-terminal hydrolase 1 [Thelephora ganbajun]|uniref:Peptidase C12 ubiquitin carboxyl-terminal hydrolase 1 n=1 Tax=Thelephora ganbajun TaxID=370292 RepID=A0ACB6ZV97_THEGA|nr:peptidase C12 ubiquitin carboxyl-terminal hydrolase 1 [Thelephora ganbajun]
MSDTRWVPLESNPDGFNRWAFKAGLIKTRYEFGDVYGLDDELLNMIPQPVKAVILLFPLADDFKKKQDARYAEKLEKLGNGHIDPTVIWIKQTIGNACGTMAMLHALANSSVELEPNSAMAQFIDLCKSKTPLERAKLLEDTPLFKTIHAETATTGQTAPPKDLHVDLHFTCFVEAPDASVRTSASGESQRRLIELDGSRDGPMDHGPVNNFLKDVAKVVQEDFMGSSESLEFNLMYLGPAAASG